MLFSEQDGAVDSQDRAAKYFAYAAELMKVNPPHATDQPIIARMKDIGNSPGKDKEANWLPAPAGDFWVVFRTYGPGQKIVEQAWKLPPLELTR